MSVEFLLTSLIVALVPGTGVVYTISSAIGGGWRGGLFATVGCTLGIVPHILAAMLGLSAIMQAGSVVFEVVRWVGVAYLVYLGVSMILAGGSLEFDTDENSSSNSRGLVIRRGILLNLLNPKLTLFFFAFLPQFLSGAPSLLDPRLVGLGAAFMADARDEESSPAAAEDKPVSDSGVPYADLDLDDLIDRLEARLRTRAERASEKTPVAEEPGIEELVQVAAGEPREGPAGLYAVGSYGAITGRRFTPLSPEAVSIHSPSRN